MSASVVNTITNECVGAFWFRVDRSGESFDFGASHDQPLALKNLCVDFWASEKAFAIGSSEFVSGKELWERIDDSHWTFGEFDEFAIASIQQF